MDSFGGNLSQCCSSIGGIDAKRKQLPRCLVSRLGALERDLWIAAQGEQILSAFEPEAVTPVSATLRA
jgi:hypothetical protein